MAQIIDPTIFDLAVALGVGLLVGVERERRKGAGPARASAGIRTFALASLTGAVAVLLGGGALLAVATIAVAGLAGLGYWRARDEDPGLTTEIALVLTTLLGGLALSRPGLAAGAAVALAVLLAARSPLHHFVRAVLGEAELRDALIFASATLIVLPLLPDRAMGPYGALNPRSIWIVVVLVLAISGAGYIAVRLLGARFGLPVSGLASGFISGVATMGAMGARAREAPQARPGAVAGAVLSNLATIAQMAVVVGAVSLATLRALAPSLACAGLAAAAYGAAFTLRSIRRAAAQAERPGRAFSLGTALGFAIILSVILVAAAALRSAYGEAGAVVAATVAGLVDTHSAAISIASLAAAGRMDAEAAVVPILAGLTANTASKAVFAYLGGGPRFAAQVAPGLALMIAAAWAGLAAGRLPPFG